MAALSATSLRSARAQGPRAGRSMAADPCPSSVVIGRLSVILTNPSDEQPALQAEARGHYWIHDDVCCQ